MRQRHGFPVVCDRGARSAVSLRWGLVRNLLVGAVATPGCGAAAPATAAAAATLGAPEAPPAAALRIRSDDGADGGGVSAAASGAGAAASGVGAAASGVGASGVGGAVTSVGTTASAAGTAASGAGTGASGATSAAGTAASGAGAEPIRQGPCGSKRRKLARPRRRSDLYKASATEKCTESGVGVPGPGVRSAAESVGGEGDVCRRLAPPSDAGLFGERAPRELFRVAPSRVRALAQCLAGDSAPYLTPQLLPGGRVALATTHKWAQHNIIWRTAGELFVVAALWHTDDEAAVRAAWVGWAEPLLHFVAAGAGPAVVREVGRFWTANAGRAVEADRAWRAAGEAKGPPKSLSLKPRPRPRPEVELPPEALWARQVFAAAQLPLAPQQYSDAGDFEKMRSINLSQFSNRALLASRDAPRAAPRAVPRKAKPHLWAAAVSKFRAQKPPATTSARRKQSAAGISRTECRAMHLSNTEPNFCWSTPAAAGASDFSGVPRREKSFVDLTRTLRAGAAVGGGLVYYLALARPRRPPPWTAEDAAADAAEAAVETAASAARRRRKTPHLPRRVAARVDPRGAEICRAFIDFVRRNTKLRLRSTVKQNPNASGELPLNISFLDYDVRTRMALQVMCIDLADNWRRYVACGNWIVQRLWNCRVLPLLRAAVAGGGREGAGGGREGAVTGGLRDNGNGADGGGGGEGADGASVSVEKGASGAFGAGGAVPGITAHRLSALHLAWDATLLFAVDEIIRARACAEGQSPELREELCPTFHEKLLERFEKFKLSAQSRRTWQTDGAERANR